MKNVKVLDCTLRDGGRIIDCGFDDQETKDIVERLSNAKIDIVEVGFLRDHRKVKYGGNSTFFTDVDQIIPFIDKDKKSTMYVAFVDYGMFDISSLKEYDGKSVDGIRLGFTKKNYVEEKEQILYWINVIKEKGYKLFVQGVNSLNYSDREMLELVDLVNEIHPYSFGIVDTYGAMYMNDIDRLFGLINHNLSEDICINFHSHNNYQLSFALAQEVIRLSEGARRMVIIDGTLDGMGKVAGNLNTELLVDYLVRQKKYDYEFEDLLDILDDYIYKYAKKYTWGYSTEAMLAGIYKSHPNNIIYLTEKFRLDTKDIGRLLSMIDPCMRQKYDYDNIEKIYTEYIAEKVDDYDEIARLKGIMENKEVLVLVPGYSLNKNCVEINNYIQKEQPMIISVNFVTDLPNAYAFFGNAKRYNRQLKKRKGKKIIITSNIQSDTDDDIIINYHRLINRGYKYFENSTIMLFNLLKCLSPRKIVIAGFDGFDKIIQDNYSDSSFQNNRHCDEFTLLNKELAAMFSEIYDIMSSRCEISFLTKSRFEKKNYK